ncbi:MAG: MerR family DNA-binding transcriptional regulator [Roseburia sp.]|nr:MerR family DNA-binding transcriptional regulator [Roseburia sp.]
MYTVKEVAELLGVSVHTVRYYDDKGLIPGTLNYINRVTLHCQNGTGS